MRYFLFLQLVLWTGLGADTPSEPGHVYVTLQNSGGVERLPDGKGLKDLAGAHYVSISSDGAVLLVSSITTGKVYQIDLKREQRKEYKIGEVAQGVKISPTGRYGIGINPKSGDAVVIDLVQKQVIKRIHVGDNPHNARFTSSGDSAYITLQGEGAIAVVDMEKLELVGKIPLEGMETPHNLDLSDDERLLWVRDFTGHAAVYTLPEGKLLATWDIGPSHGGIDWIPGGMYVATTAIGGDEVTILDAKTFKVVRRIKVGKAPHGVRASRDGKKLYVTVGAENRVAVIDLKTFAVDTLVTQGTFPFWIAVQDNP